ncbi:MAG: hypothetical protein ACLQIJ_09575 [Polyangia bacterium]
MEVELLSYGNGGWVRYESDDLSCPAFVRFVTADDGRLIPADLFLSDEQGLDAELLRNVPLGRIQARVNLRPELVRLKIKRPGPDLRRLVSYFATRLPHGHEHDDWVSRSFASQMVGFDEPTPKMLPLSDGSPEPAPRLDKSEAVLSVPTSRTFGNDFYREVAAVYVRVALRVNNPASFIADATGGIVPSQVHRWVKIARAKGFLPPGRVGKAG